MLSMKDCTLFPKRLMQDAIYVTVFLTNPNDIRFLLLTDQLILFELKDTHIISSFNLKRTKLKELDTKNFPRAAAFSEQKQQQNDSGHDTEHFETIKDKRICFGKYISYDVKGKIAIVLVKILDVLVALEWISDKGLKLLKEYKNVSTFEIIDPEQCYNPIVAITFVDNPQPLYTKFPDNIVNSKTKAKADSVREGELEIIKTITEEVDKAKIELAVHEEVTSSLFLRTKNLLTFGPNHIRGDTLEEKHLLSKYGDVWMRINSAELVIGIPVVNNAVKRLATLRNIRPTLICSTKRSYEFEYKLFTLKDDSYSFENFYDILKEHTEEDRDVRAPDMNAVENQFRIDEEWTPISENLLYPETSGVLILKTKLDSFMGVSAFTVVCFVLYDISDDDETFTLQNFVKSFEICADLLQTPDVQTICEMGNTVYKDILAVTSVSDMAAIKITYNVLESTKLSDFITQTLKFICLQEQECPQQKPQATEQSINFNISSISLKNSCSYIFYHNGSVHNYLQGTLIRLIEHKDKKKTDYLKIYARSESILLAFIQILYQTFPSSFKILPWNTKCFDGVSYVRKLQKCLDREMQTLNRFYMEKKGLVKFRDLKIIQNKLFKCQFETDMIM